MKALTTALLASALTSALLCGPAMAQQKSDEHAGHHAAGAAKAATVGADMTDGEVRRIDKEGGRLTLKHAEIKSLDMPPMTMVFVVRDKAVLDKLKVGDKIKFKAVNDAGKYTVTEIQVAP